MQIFLLCLMIVAATAGCIYGINRDERRQQDDNLHRRRAADAPRSFR